MALCSGMTAQGGGRSEALWLSVDRDGRGVLRRSRGLQVQQRAWVGGRRLRVLQQGARSSNPPPQSRSAALFDYAAFFFLVVAAARQKGGLQCTCGACAVEGPRTTDPFEVGCEVSKGVCER